MAVNTTPIFADSANVTPVTFVNADSTTPKDVFVAGADGSKVTAINCTSDDTVARTMLIYLRRSSVNYLLGSKVVPTLAGTNGTEKSVNLLDGDLIPVLDRDNGIFLASGDSIRVGPSVAVTAAKTITLVGIGVNY